MIEAGAFFPGLLAYQKDNGNRINYIAGEYYKPWLHSGYPFGAAMHLTLEGLLERLTLPYIAGDSLESEGIDLGAADLLRRTDTYVAGALRTPIDFVIPDCLQDGRRVFAGSINARHESAERFAAMLDLVNALMNQGIGIYVPLSDSYYAVVYPFVMEQGLRYYGSAYDNGAVKKLKTAAEFKTSDPDNARGWFRAWKVSPRFSSPPDYSADNVDYIWYLRDSERPASINAYNFERDENYNTGRDALLDAIDEAFRGWWGVVKGWSYEGFNAYWPNTFMSKKNAIDRYTPLQHGFRLPNLAWDYHDFSKLMAAREWYDESDYVYLEYNAEWKSAAYQGRFMRKGLNRANLDMMLACQIAQSYASETWARIPAVHKFKHTIHERAHIIRVGMDGSKNFYAYSDDSRIEERETLYYSRKAYYSDSGDALSGTVFTPVAKLPAYGAYVKDSLCWWNTLTDDMITDEEKAAVAASASGSIIVYREVPCEPDWGAYRQNVEDSYHWDIVITTEVEKPVDLSASMTLYSVDNSVSPYEMKRYPNHQLVDEGYITSYKMLAIQKVLNRDNYFALDSDGNWIAARGNGGGVAIAEGEQPDFRIKVIDEFSTVGDSPIADMAKALYLSELSEYPDKAGVLTTYDRPSLTNVKIDSGEITNLREDEYTPHTYYVAYKVKQVGSTIYQGDYIAIYYDRAAFENGDDPYDKDAEPIVIDGERANCLGYRSDWYSEATMPTLYFADMPTDDIEFFQQTSLFLGMKWDWKIFPNLPIDSDYSG